MLLYGNKGKLNHVTYIYGYDSGKKQIYMSDNFYKGKNSCQRLRYDNVQKAFNIAREDGGILSGNSLVNFYKIKDDYKYEISFFKMQKEIEDYLDSKPNNEIISNEHTSWGIEAYADVVERFRDTGEPIEINNLSFLHDVAIVNQIRINALIKNGIHEKELDGIIECVKKEMKVTDKALYLALKNIITKDKECLKRVCEMIESFIAYEIYVGEGIIRICDERLK